MKPWDDTARLLLSMRLPVIGGRGAATTEAMVRAVRKGAAELSRSIATAEEPMEGGVAFITPGRAFIGDANAARDVHTPAGLRPAEVLSTVAATFGRLDAACAMLVPAAARLEDEWPTLLSRHGFATRRQSLLAMDLAVEPQPHSSNLQVISARAVGANYRAFLERFFLSRGTAADAASEASACEAGFLDLDSFDLLAARHAGRVIGSIGVLTVAEMGLFRGLRVESGSPPGTVDTLLCHLLDLCKRSQFRQMIAAVNEGDDDTLSAFARIGMKKIATIESYVHPGIEVMA